MITCEEYLMGNERRFSLSYSPTIEHNAQITVELVNQLLVAAAIADVRLELNPRTHSFVYSGWRSPEVNADIPGASIKSKHLSGQAVDLYDPEGDLDDWLMTEDGQRTLHDLGLWMEHPACTKNWSHIQTVPPLCKKRVFFP